ncbi:uncharacterized protein EAE97_009001 [Botrytis byssoidea]|uniref:Uncharacterized protein n=1 Tax=Botrytis byssoidea TaxID=139641 RepID=A0A9P5IB18_9HELO|nr:uncharacterized protein EAE97_009001 [Botrytis byssoidea]KAF7931980.1 hypothetical protein EAE97_009001 [Botrytis byssoidea]
MVLGISCIAICISRRASKLRRCEIESIARRETGFCMPIWRYLSCAPLLPIQNIESKAKILGKLSIDYSNIHFDCLEDTSSFDIGSKMRNVYILRLFSKEGLILRCIKEIQGVYERIGHILLLEFKDSDLGDEVCHAEESAYVPREKHNFDTDKHVILLV